METYIGGKSADQNVLIVADSLRQLKSYKQTPHSYAIFRACDECNYYVQALRRVGVKKILLEGVSNVFLCEKDQLSQSQINALLNLGWNEMDVEEKPNYWRTWSVHNDSDIQDIARFLMETLVKVYGFTLNKRLDVTLEHSDLECLSGIAIE
jgi:hypothetical protein